MSKLNFLATTSCRNSPTKEVVSHVGTWSYLHKEEKTEDLADTGGLWGFCDGW